MKHRQKDKWGVKKGWILEPKNKERYKSHQNENQSQLIPTGNSRGCSYLKSMHKISFVSRINYFSNSTTKRENEE